MSAKIEAGTSTLASNWIIPVVMPTLPQPNQLSISTLQLGWGGKQKPMGDSILTENDVGLFDHDQRIRVGEMQSMVFKEGGRSTHLMPHYLILFLGKEHQGLRCK
jgi:hypothetical protein